MACCAVIFFVMRMNTNLFKTFWKSPPYPILLLIVIAQTEGRSKMVWIKEAIRINCERRLIFPGNRGGSLILQQACDWSEVQREGRHSERTAAVLGKWPTGATLPIVPQCGNITSCWWFPRRARTQICIPRAQGILQNCFHSAGLTNRYVEEHWEEQTPGKCSLPCISRPPITCKGEQFPASLWCWGLLLCKSKTEGS